MNQKRAQSPRTLPIAQSRRKARQRALQALYQAELNPLPSYDLIQQFTSTQDMSKTDIEYFSELVKQVIDLGNVLQDKIKPYISVPIKQLDPIERCILNISAYELLYRADIPFRVVINEAIDLAKKYGASEAYKFINGVLDKAAQELRQNE